MANEPLNNPESYQYWAQYLHEKGLAFLAIQFLENGGFLRPLLGQFLTAGTALISADQQKWQALAEMLTDRDAAQQLSAALKKEPPDT